MTMATTEPLNQWETAGLKAQLARWRTQYDGLSGGNLKLDLGRGKPGVEQISLSDGLDGVLDSNFIAEDGTDTRNYGGVRGIAEARPRVPNCWAFRQRILLQRVTPASVLCTWFCAPQQTSGFGVTSALGRAAIKESYWLRYQDTTGTSLCQSTSASS